jgi:hypothetical protein
MNDKLIHTYNDDWCYSVLLWLNGYKFTPCSSYSMQNGSIDKNGTKLKKYNDIEPMGRNNVYVDRKQMYDILEKRLLDLFGVSFKKSFCILMNKDINDMMENSNNTNRLYKSNMIQKLREGIRNGTIVKEYKQDGTYIWRKLRK